MTSSTTETTAPTAPPASGEQPPRRQGGGWSSRLRWAGAGAAVALLPVGALALGPRIATLPWADRDGASAYGDELSWAPPALDDPEVVEVGSDTSLELDADQDYTVVLPDEPLVSDKGLTITGGRNVVLVGGRIEARERGLLLRDQTGTVHVEGLSIGGEGLQEGVNLEQGEGATVQLQNIRVDRVTGSEEGHHADLLQTWAGPERLRVDGFAGETDYQGFFLLPMQYGEQQPEEWDLRRVALTGVDDAKFLFWTDDDAPWLTSSEVVVETVDGREDDQVLEGRTDGVAVGDAASVVMPQGEPGVGYESPGYARG